MVKALADVSAQPTIVVNNAGMVTVSDETIAQGSIDMSTSDWNDALGMNLTTAFTPLRLWCVSTLHARAHPASCYSLSS